MEVETVFELVEPEQDLIFVPTLWLLLAGMVHYLTVERNYCGPEELELHDDLTHHHPARKIIGQSIKKFKPI